MYKYETHLHTSPVSRCAIASVEEFRVSGEKIQVVEMIPGYTHNIINLSENEDLVTVMWANEPFDHEKPDTFYQEV